MSDTITLEQLPNIYKEPETCAQLIGLAYSSSSMPGYTRRRAGKGFSYITNSGKPVNDKHKKRIDELVIPPAWQEVWICPDETAHILVTGIDEKGRKQYIYHPKWRIARDLLKFYRSISFARQLPIIRKNITELLSGEGLTHDRVIAAMLWILDNTYIRIGNNIYLEQNESVGLTTLADHNIVIAGPVVNFSFKAKSGKDQQFSVEDQAISKIMAALKQSAGERFFQYKDEEGGFKAIEAPDLNSYLQQLCSAQITAKDFRTWGGTLMAFNHLIENRDTDKKPEKLIVEAVDTAANVLGNTRAVAKSAYVHPHILDTYGSKNFDHYYEKASRSRKIPGLDRSETTLLYFLEQLFKEEFDLLKH